MKISHNPPTAKRSDKHMKTKKTGYAYAGNPTLEAKQAALLLLRVRKIEIHTELHMMDTLMKAELDQHEASYRGHLALFDREAESIRRAVPNVEEVIRCYRSQDEKWEQDIVAKVDGLETEIKRLESELPEAKKRLEELPRPQIGKFPLDETDIHNKQVVREAEAEVRSLEQELETRTRELGVASRDRDTLVGVMPDQLKEYLGKRDSLQGKVSEIERLIASRDGERQEIEESYAERRAELEAEDAGLSGQMAALSKEIEAAGKAATPAGK